MESLGNARSVTWILMKHAVWWPVQLNDSSSCDFEQASPRVKRVTIHGSGEELFVDMHDASSVQHVEVGSPEFQRLCNLQVLPHHLKDRFDRSVAALQSGIPQRAPLADEAMADKKRDSKRVGAISWDDYFMAVAFLSSMRSKDPSTQVGACIVNSDQRIVGIGYNGFPRGCSDDDLPWTREALDPLDTKYPYVCHAEMNAILNKNSADVNRCRMYVALFPCNECAKMIIQSGIKEVVYMSDKHHATVSMTASRTLLAMAKVKVRQFTPSSNVIPIDFGLPK